MTGVRGVLLLHGVACSPPCCQLGHLPSFPTATCQSMLSAQIKSITTKAGRSLTQQHNAKILVHCAAGIMLMLNSGQRLVQAFCADQS